MTFLKARMGSHPHLAGFGYPGLLTLFLVLLHLMQGTLLIMLGPLQPAKVTTHTGQRQREKMNKGTKKRKSGGEPEPRERDLGYWGSTGFSGERWRECRKASGVRWGSLGFDGGSVGGLLGGERPRRGVSR